MRRYPTPPPMSPATSSAHNFYSGFAPRHTNNSPPISQNQQPPPPPPPPSGPTSRPGSTAPASHNQSYYISPSGYANAQYYDGRQSGLGLGGWTYTSGGGAPSTSVGASAGMQPAFANMKLGPSPSNMSEDAYRKYVHEHQQKASPPPPLKIKTPNTANYGPQTAGLPYRATSPPQHPYNYPPASAGLPRMTPPPLTSNKSFNNNGVGQNIQRPPSQASSRMPGAFPEDSARSDLPFRNPIVGVKAAAKAKEQGNVDQTSNDPYWGYLFDHDNSPPVAKELLSQFLRGIADYIIEDFEPKKSLVITPPKMMAFYTKFKSLDEAMEWDNFFFGRPVKALSEIYQVLNCHHHLVPPKDSASSAPTVPGLTPRGFERWMTVHILANPDREAKRLISVLKQCPIQKHDEKDPMLRRFPKTLTRNAFPKYFDREMKNLWELFTPDDANLSSQISKPINPVSSKDVERDLERAAMEKEREREAIIEERRQRELLDMERDRAAYEQGLEREQRGHLDKLERSNTRSNTKQPNSDDLSLKRTKSKASTVRHYEDEYNERELYETMPPPPLPLNNGVERERKPYARTTSGRREDVALLDSDDEYEGTPQHTNTTFTRPRANTRTSGLDMGSYHRPTIKIPMHQPYPSSSPHDSPPPAAKYSDLDREEEDLYQMMAAKQAEIAAIEERLSRQRSTTTQSFSSHRPPSAALDHEEEEAQERLRRAEVDWEREERERKRWAEQGRQRYETDYGQNGSRDGGGELGVEEYTVGTPISSYSWRDSYGGAPMGPGGKRATTGGGRISGGGEWEEFKYDEVSPVRTRKEHLEPERW